MSLSLNEAVIQAKEAPCTSEITNIIMVEVQSGNIVKAFDTITPLHDETNYILLFADLPKAEYADAKTFRKKNDTEYKVIYRSDHNGCTEIGFNF